MESFKLTLEHLDHVAIRIKDMNESVDWYQKVLGLKKYQLEKWGEFPIFMLAGKTGITLFPADLSDTKLELNSKNIKIDHFAFKVSKDNFEHA